MRQLEDVRTVRWFDSRLEIEGESGLLHATTVAADDLVIIGFRIRAGLRYLAARLPAGSSVVLDQRGGRTALAVSVKQAG